eukprot:g71707.t1
MNTVQKLKHLNGVIKNKVKELRNKKIEDLDQIVVQMKRNPRKAWSILRKFLEKEPNSPRQIENNEGAIVTGNTAAEVFANQKQFNRPLNMHTPTPNKDGTQLRMVISLLIKMRF